jgi:VanZ family protein
MVLGFCAVAWWPFAFWPTNQVRWLTEPPGLHFAENAIIRDAAVLPTPANAATREAADFTVELWLEADALATNDVAHILTIHDRQLPSNFVLCQWKQEILLRVPNEHSRSSIREVGADGALEPTRAKLITITGSAAGTDFYFDGVPQRQFPGFKVAATAFRGKLIVGNAANGNHAWNGKILGLALYQRALDAGEVAQHHAQWMVRQARQFTNDPSVAALYLFEEGDGKMTRDSSRHGHQMAIPSTYRVPHKEFLAPWGRPMNQGIDYDDIVTNVLGFVPFGFCFFLHRRSRSRRGGVRDALVVVFTGAVISLVLETVQFWLGNRDSSLLDVICNTTGTWFGVMVASTVRSKNNRAKTT